MNNNKTIKKNLNTENAPSRAEIQKAYRERKKAIATEEKTI